MFNSFKKEVVLHAYTDRASAYEYAQLYKASTDKPKWWKKLPILEDSARESNMKHCAGFNDLYAKAIMQPLWSDVAIRYAGQGEDWWEYQYSDETSTAVVHPEHQREGWAKSDEYQHIKLSSPWRLFCDDDVEFLFTNAAYENPNPLDWFVPNGVVNFKHQHSIEVNLFIKREITPKDLFLPFRTPLGMYVPLTERKVRIEHHLVTDQEWQQINNKAVKNLTWQRSYYKQKKCPFSGKNK
jgi:hypothetical protein